MHIRFSRQLRLSSKELWQELKKGSKSEATSRDDGLFTNPPSCENFL